MVGFEGDRPDGMVQTTRIRAVNPFWPNLILRECEIQDRCDKLPWKVGDEIGLNQDKVWTERNNAKVYAIIVEIL